MGKTKYFCSFLIVLLIFMGTATNAACTHTYKTQSTTTMKIATSSKCTRTRKKQVCSKCSAVRYLYGAYDTTHSYSSKVTKSATCTTAGTRKYTCTACGYNYTSSISKLGHNYKKVSTTINKISTSSTCTTTLLKEKCSRCSLLRSTITATDTVHNYSSSITKNSTCTATGTRKYACTDCNYNYTKSIGALGHNMVESTTTSKSATKAVCQTTYLIAKCSRCTYSTKSIVSTDKTHIFSSTVTVQPKCAVAGTRKYTCGDCGYSYTESIAVLGHDFSDPGYVVNASGHFKRCVRCSTADVTSAHVFDMDKCIICKYPNPCKHTNRVEATCVKNGYCNDCKATLTNRTHKLDNSTATNLGNGNHSRKCMYCEYKLNTPHIYTNYICNLCGFKNVSEIESTTVLNSSQEENFDRVITTVLNNTTSYNMSAGTRDSGFNAYKNYLNNGTSFDGTVSFDCSSFASLVVSQSTGISCIRDDGVTSYSTYYFSTDKVNFIHTDCTESGIDVDSLEKGQLILCMDDAENGIDHIMVYAGNGEIVHANGTYDCVTRNELSPDDEYTAQFLSTDAGKYDRIYILTPSPEPKE